MSHLKHINNYKKELIAAGITDPQTQINLSRTAYVSAFVQLIERHRIPEADRKDVMYFVLNYWNETFPVNGNIVVMQVNSFYDRLCEALCAGGTIFVQLVNESSVTDHPTYCDFESYKLLVASLVEEAEHKYKHRKVA